MRIEENNVSTTLKWTTCIQEGVQETSQKCKTKRLLVWEGATLPFPSLPPIWPFIFGRLHQTFLLFRPSIQCLVLSRQISTVTIEVVGTWRVLASSTIMAWYNAFPLIWISYHLLRSPRWYTHHPDVTRSLDELTRSSPSFHPCSLVVWHWTKLCYKNSDGRTSFENSTN